MLFQDVYRKEYKLSDDTDDDDLMMEGKSSKKRKREVDHEKKKKMKKLPNAGSAQAKKENMVRMSFFYKNFKLRFSSVLNKMIEELWPYYKYYGVSAITMSKKI